MIAGTALALAACASAVAPSPDAGEPGGAPESSPPASSTPNGVVVIMRTAGDEEYRILLTDAAEIATAEALAAGNHDPMIPLGTIVRTDDGGVNTGYSWHIDPASFEWAEMTMELCDGQPSYVEDGTLSGDTFCPWSARVVSVEPAD